MKISFTQKLVASYLLVVAVTLAGTAWYLTPRLERSFFKQLEESMAVHATLAARLLTPSQSGLQTRTETLGRELGYRLTVIDRDGRVRADSVHPAEAVARMDNHAERPEVKAAFAKGFGESMRYSSTLQKDLLYIAVPIGGSPAQGVLRLALPTTEVERRVAHVQKGLAQAGALALFAAWIIALLMARRISQPLRQLLERTRGTRSGDESHDEFGRLAGTISGLTRQIGQQVEEVQRDRSQLSAILSALVESVIAVDHQGRLILMNPAAELFFTTPFDSVKGRPFLEALRYSDLNDIVQTTLRTGSAVQREITLHNPNERRLSVQSRAVDYGEGRTGVLLAMHDISELQRLATVRQEFVANVSHELRTPLTAIRGYVETLLDGALEDPKHHREFLQTVQDNVTHLSQLIDDLLDLSRIEARRMAYRFTPVALHEIALRVAKALESAAKTKQVQLEMKIPADLPRAFADPDRLMQVFMNLVDNAIKFNRPHGRVTVTANVDGEDLHVAVADTGAGIAEEDVPRVFERFFRGDRSHSHTTQGTGLGLAIVKHLIEAHSGTVRAESILGQGSTFHFTLPLA